MEISLRVGDRRPALASNTHGRCRGALELLVWLEQGTQASTSGHSRGNMEVLNLGGLLSLMEMAWVHSP